MVPIVEALQPELFGHWLKTLGYAPSTVYQSVRYARDFLHYLSSMGMGSQEALPPDAVTLYLHHLQLRSNKRQGGGLSVNYINSNINAVKRLSHFLVQTSRPSFEVRVHTRPDKESPRMVLTLEEIQALYAACPNTALGQRDRAMLGIYYGCGLRRSEGLALNLSDIQFGHRLVRVQHGKGNFERYVPMTSTVRNDLELYILQGREEICCLKSPSEPALLLSLQARRMSGNAMIERIHKLSQAAGIRPGAGLHSLRHTIATHLLRSGLSLEELSQFLGHHSLESTQIYTHLLHEQET